MDDAFLFMALENKICSASDWKQVSGEFCNNRGPQVVSGICRPEGAMVSPTSPNALKAVCSFASTPWDSKASIQIDVSSAGTGNGKQVQFSARSPWLSSDWSRYLRKPFFSRSFSNAKDVEEKSSLRVKVQAETSELYKSLATGMLRYLLCISRDFDLTQDAVQEAFLRYYENRLSGSLAPQSRGWVFKVARNYLIDQIRASKPEVHTSLEEGLPNPDYRYCPHEALVRVEILARLSAILTVRELECLQLRAEGFTYREISDIMNIASGTVGAILAHGLKKVRAYHVNKAKERGR